MPFNVPSLRARLSAGGPPLVVGHRGAMRTRPENTLAAFQHAAALGADMVEFDVHLSRDGQPVVIHDERLERTTNGRGWVGEHTLSELHTLEAGAWFSADFAGARIPTLDEALGWARDTAMAVDVELKHGPRYDAAVESMVVAALRRFGLLDRALVTSFDHVAVARVKDLALEVMTGVLYVGRPVEPVALARASAADVLLPEWSHVMASDVSAAHAAGLGVIAWATSDAQASWPVLELGVDGVCTNDPTGLREMVDAAWTMVRAAA